MQYVMEQLSKQIAACHGEIDHFQSVLARDGFGAELKEKAKAQVAIWQHRKEQCENAMLILELTCCKKDEAALS